MPSRKALQIGDSFGLLKVTGEAESSFDPRGVQIYCVMAKCQCGTEIRVRESSLRAGNTKSCGCLQIKHSKSGIANKRHGLSYTRTHRCWRSLIQRCTNSKSINFNVYGGRGIKVCERWKEFDNFLLDMGMCPPEMSIDRIDNDGDYEPSNCRWADRKTQSENTSQVKLVTLNGDVMSTTAALKKLGLSAGQAIDRMKRKGESRQQAIDYYAMHGKSR